MPRKLRDSVVIVTGASSGIGRATALEMARRGATVVLAARSEEPLGKIASECRNLTLQALAVPTDVANAAAVQALADRAIETFGRIDVWVNNAAVSVIARFEDTPAEALRRVIETNLMGYIHGARSALRYFREQDAGVLINVSSQVALGGKPYASAYVITKYAIRGLTDCLRQEFLNTDIHVCTVLPGSVDTPHYTHAANYPGKAVKPNGPILDTECVAKTIVDLAENPKHEVMVGRSGHLLSALHGFAPSIYERAAVWKVNRNQFQDATAEPTAGNLFEPMQQFSSVCVLRYLEIVHFAFILHDLHYLSRDLWRILQGEHHRTLMTPLFVREWPLLRTEFNFFSNFIKYVDSIQHGPTGLNHVPRLNLSI